MASAWQCKTNWFGGVVTGKTVAAEGRGSHFGRDGSKGGSSGVDSGGKFMGIG